MADAQNLLDPLLKGTNAVSSGKETGFPPQQSDPSADSSQKPADPTPSSEHKAQPQQAASTLGPGLFDSFFSTINDLGKQTQDAIGDIGNTVVNLGTHATKLSTSQIAAEQQWREFFSHTRSESEEDEQLKFFFFCNLLTSIGPCPGTLFVTNKHLCFLSDSELEYNVGPEETEESHYRVSIPLGCIGGLSPRINPSNDIDRYIRVVTADEYSFWFNGFINYDSAFAHLLAALHDAGRQTDSLLSAGDKDDT